MITHIVNQTSTLNTTTSSGPTYSFFLAIPTAVQLLLCGIVLFLFCRHPRLRTASNLPVVNLIASDVARTVLSLLAIFVYGAAPISKPSTADNILCAAVQYINNAQFAWSSWAIAIIAYSRYDTVVNVFTPKFSKKHFWVFAMISWLVSLLTAMPPLIGWSSYGFTRRGGRCTTGSNGDGLLHAAYLPSFYIVNFLVPTVFVIICFCRIFLKVRSHLKYRNTDNSLARANVAVLTSTSLSSNQSEQQQHRETVGTRVKEIISSRAFRYIAAIVMTNLLLVTPFACVKCYSAVCSELGMYGCVPRIAYQISSIVFALNFNVNAFLYVFWVKTMRQFAMSLCCSCQEHGSNRTP